jgi:hypothetical protein
MRRRRILLTTLSVILLLPAFFLTTKDVFVDNENCGAALFPRNTSQLIQSTGDAADDEFQAEALAEQCSRDHSRQWFFAALFLGLALVSAVFAYRSKDREPRFPGDPVI